MRVQSVFRMSVRRQLINLMMTAVMLTLAVGFCWQTAFAANPAGFLGGIYAFAGDPSNRFTFVREGAGIALTGPGLGTNIATLTSGFTAGMEAAGEQTGYNGLYADRGQWRYTAFCMQYAGGVCVQYAFNRSSFSAIGFGAEAVAIPYPAVVTLIGDGSGVYSGLQLSGSYVPPITINFVKENVNGHEYLTIPWTVGNTDALGVKGGYPQVHIPLSNGLVAFDFDGNGVADPDLLVSPRLTGTAAAGAIPTLSEWGMILLTLMLMLGGVLMLRRSHVRISLT